MFGQNKGATGSGGGGFSFGSSATKPATTGGFSFGQTAASTTSTSTGGFSFGQQSAGANASPSKGFSFGASTTQQPQQQQPQQQASTGFGFGQTASTPNQSKSFFGGFSSTPTQSGSTLFGNKGLGSATPSSSAGFFSQPIAGGAQAQQSGALTTFPLQSVTALTPELHLQLIQSAYDPQSSTNRFRHFFFNDDPANVGRVGCPPGVDEALWNQALKNNPDPSRYVPQMVCGFEELNSRITRQAEKIKQLNKTLEDLGATMSEIHSRHQLETVVQLEQYKRRHFQVSHRILRVMSRLEVLNARGYCISQEEETFRVKLEALARALAQPTQFKGRLNELQSLVRIQQSRGAEKYEISDEQTLEDIHKFLTQQREGIERLSNVMQKDLRDMGILLKETASHNHPHAHEEEGSVSDSFRL
eukprot:GCRY01003874.1.p1 GENE.GCRY01003874.1~~GCRY01003874.1.p1  ORF type:complete len:417 (-),score=103.06 GCRY01003874.1:151-1401(-)